MDDFAKAAGDRLLSGIPAKYWRRFLKIFTETATDHSVERVMANLSEELAGVWRGSQEQMDDLLEHFREIARLVPPDVVVR